MFASIIGSIATESIALAVISVGVLSLAFVLIDARDEHRSIVDKRYDREKYDATRESEP